MNRLALVGSLLAAAVASYQVARRLTLGQAKAALAAPAPPRASMPPAGPTHLPALPPPPVSGAVSLSSSGAEVSLPADLSPLDTLCLERGLPAVLLRGRLLAELRAWARSAKDVCWPEGRGGDPGEVLVRFQVQAAASSIRIAHVAEAIPYNGAPVSAEVRRCVDRELRRRENTEIHARQAGFPPFEGPVDVRVRLGDGSLCSK